MYDSGQEAIEVRGIDLANEADFDLGLLRVRPAQCKVEGHGVSRTLQRRVMQVLVALARARGSVVSQSALVAECWRGLTVSDDAIYRCISKLRKLAGEFPDPPFSIEAIPGVGYRLSSQRTDEAPSCISPAGKQPRARPFLVAVAILIAVLAGAAAWMLLHRSPEHRPLSVAVQAFDTLSDSADSRSLAQRIPNEIVDSLGDSHIQSALRSEQLGTGESGQSPGLVVTGILRDDGKSAIVGVRIEDGTNRTALWSAEFTRDSQATSDLPAEVAARVVDAVSMIDFARNANPPLSDDSALTALLQTHDMLRGANDDAWASMLHNAQDLVARYPQFAFGHDVLAAAYVEASENVGVPDRAQALRDAAGREANLTIQLDPQDAGAYAVLAGLVAPYDHQRREAILLRGLKLAKHPKQPLAGLYSYQGIFLAGVGRLREALSLQMVAHAADEWAAPRSTKLALTYANMGDAAHARETLNRAVRLWPNHPGVWKALQYFAGFYESPEEAMAVFRRLDERPSFRESNAIWRAFVEARTARSAQTSTAASSKILAAADRGIIPRETAIMMLAALGETKQAIEAADFALGRQPLQPGFLFTPITRNLREDPGFVGLANRMGLITYWRNTGRWPDFCADRRVTKECRAELLAAISKT